MGRIHCIPPGETFTRYVFSVLQQKCFLCIDLPYDLKVHFIRDPYDLTCSFVVLLTEPTHITTKRTAAHLRENYAAYAHAQKANHVTPLTDSLTPLYHGVFLIRETGIITGQGCTAGSSWTDTSVPPSQILSPWENRSIEFFI